MDERLVAISGWMGCGKSTLAQKLVDKHQFALVSIGTMIKKVANLAIEDQAQLTGYLAEVFPDQKEALRIGQLIGALYGQNYAKAVWEKEEGSYKKQPAYRQWLQQVASLLREEFGEDIWMRFVAGEAMNYAAEGQHVVCDDLRYPSEKRLFEQLGFACIRLNISREEQKKRLENRYGSVSEGQLTHKTETSLDTKGFDFELDVTSLSEEEVLQQIETYLRLTPSKRAMP